MRNVFPSSNIFLKHLFSYITILLIPLFIFYLYIYNYNMQLFKDEMMNSYEDKLVQTREILDLQIEDLFRITTQVNYSTELTKYWVERNMSNAKSTSDLLKSLSIHNRYISEVLLYYFGEEHIYSSSGIYFNWTFLKQVLNYSEMNEADFLKNIETAKTPSILPAKENRMITYIFPIPLGSTSAKGAIIFLLNEDNIKKIFSNALGNQTGNVILMDKASNIISSLEDNEFLHTRQFSDKINIEKDLYTELVEYKQHHYYLTVAKSKFNGWKYVTLIPNDQLLMKIQKLNTNTIYGFLFIVIIAGIVIYFVMRVNYIPLKNLRRFAEDKLGELLPEKNEFDSIRKAVEQISSKADLLNEKVLQNMPVIRKAQLARLIKGRFHEVSELKKNGGEMGILFNNRYFAVAILYLNCEQTIMESLVAELEAVVCKQDSVIIIDDFDNHSIQCLVVLPENNYSKIEDILTPILDHLLTLYNIEATFGVGNIYESVEDACKSYIEALSSIDYRLIKSSSRFLFYKDLPLVNTNTIKYPDEELDHLELHLLQGETEKAVEIVEGLMNMIKRENVPVLIAKTLCFDLINKVIKVTYRINREMGLAKENTTDILALSRFDTIEELSDNVKNIFKDISIAIAGHKACFVQKYTDQLINYLKENFDDINFSVQNMADYFQILAPNLSQYFINHVGESISDYINRLRMEKAKKLLLETDEKLQDIIFKVGYTNVSSFVRRFRLEHGLTPGNYRELYRKMYMKSTNH